VKTKIRRKRKISLDFLHIKASCQDNFLRNVETIESEVRKIGKVVKNSAVSCSTFERFDVQSEGKKCDYFDKD
jgi:hypothetical protein